MKFWFGRYITVHKPTLFQRGKNNLLGYCNMLHLVDYEI